MARIRTIKPEFFQHERLYDAEAETGLPLRVAFAGLWTVADRAGRFEWRPRQIKLNVLPYDEVDFSRVLDALATRGFIVRYASQDREYGAIPSWNEHQVINNRETASLLPEPPEVIEPPNELTRASRVDDACPTPLGNAQAEGKGREGKGKGKEDPPGPPVREMMDIWNEVCAEQGLAQAVKLPPARRRSLGLRLEEDFASDLDQWRAYCQRIAASEFLTGQAPPGPGRDRPFKADIDWVLKSANLAKIVEGNYGGTNGANGQDTGPYLGEFEDDLRTDYRRLMRFQDNGEWMDHWGPKPDEPDCRIAAEVMAKYGPAAP